MSSKVHWSVDYRRYMGTAAPVKVAISSCLLGNRVRWDGTHKRDSLLVAALGRFVEWVPVCPEVEAGMDVPRDPVRLVRDQGQLRLVGASDGSDYSRATEVLLRKRLRQFEQRCICGCVFKSKSPSCGLSEVPVFGVRGARKGKGRGVFAGGVTSYFPAMPVEDERRLREGPVFEHFVERVFAYWRLTFLMRYCGSLRDLARFHASQRLQLALHSPRAAKVLERLITGKQKLAGKSLIARYRDDFMAALGKRVTAERHTRLMQLLLERLRGKGNECGWAASAAAVEAYHAGEVPLAVPLVTLRRLVEDLAIAEFVGQSYLWPEPAELFLRTRS